jgi:hypothetical protein
VGIGKGKGERGKWEGSERDRILPSSGIEKKRKRRENKREGMRGEGGVEEGGGGEGNEREWRRGEGNEWEGMADCWEE